MGLTGLNPEQGQEGFVMTTTEQNNGLERVEKAAITVSAVFSGTGGSVGVPFYYRMSQNLAAAF